MQSQVIEGYQLSPQQKLVWPEQQRSPALHAQCAVQVEGYVDLDALRLALQRLLDRHEILRTAFERLPGMDAPIQVVTERAVAVCEETDLSRAAPTDRQGLIAALLDADSGRAFDFARPPLVRFSLLKLTPELHVLAATLPALCADGRTLVGLYREVAHGYAEILGGQERSEEPLQYIEFSEWCHSLPEEPDAQRGQEFWRRQTAATAPPPRLPLEADGGDGDSEFFPASLPITVAPDLLTALEAFACDHGQTVPTALLACWHVLLGRLAAAPEIAVYVRFDGRKYPELQGVFGLLEQYLPVSVRISDTPSFGTLLQRIARAVEEVHRWQEYFAPAEPMVAERAQVAFDFETWVDEPAGGGPVFRLIARRCCTVRAKLRLSCVRVGEDWRLDLHYDPDLYRKADAERLASQYATLLAGAVASPDRPVADLDLLGEAERRELLVEWNRTACPLTGDLTVHRRFEAQVERTPELPAVLSGEDRLTYRELNERANRLARYLRSRGVGPESLVVLCLGRSVEMILALLGILKAGAAYVPLDAGQPRPRLAHMIADAQASLVLTERALASVFEGGEVPVVCVDALWEQLAAEGGENLEITVVPENLAYVIFTSGSTGRPKGTMVRHRSVVNLAVALEREVYAGLSGALRVSVNAPLAFDASVKQVVQLLTGRALVIIPEEVRRDGDAMLSYLERCEVEVLDCTPAQLRFLLGAGLGGGACPALCLVLVGGEAIDAHLWQAAAAVPGICFVNVYGPTECTVDVTACRIAVDQSRPVIGRPLSNVRTYLLDRGLRPVPTGVAGELFVGGDGLARGYASRPAPTAEKFLPDPWSERPGARLYRTGDLLRHLPGGGLEFVGRVDHQVKIRGFRIELGEVESVLASHSAVREAVVTVREEPSGDRRLVAYVVPSSGEGAGSTLDALRAFVRERLPEYMLPAAFVVLDALPLTRNGKVDRTTLPAPERTASGREAGHERPRTQVQELLAEIWGDLLGYERVGIESNFFELGGHSLLATQLVSRVRSAFGVELLLRSLFDAPTVAELSAIVEEALRSEDLRELPPLVPAGRDRALPLSFAQQRLWFLDRLTPGNPFYNLPLRTRMIGALDTGVLARALSEIVRRHEVLRTRFLESEGEPLQIIDAPRPILLPVVDLGGLSAAVGEEEARRLAAAEAALPFDLTRGPLIRGMLLRLGAEDHAALLTAHHIAGDGWSLGILFREMAVLYGAFREGEPSPLEDLPLQYADFACWQRSWLQGEALERQIAAWRRRLAGAPPFLDIPADHPRPALQRFRGARQRLEIDPESTSALRRLCRSERATLFMSLLAIFQALMGRCSGQEDVSVGTPVAGRNRLETEPLIGCFINTLVLRTDLSGEPSFRELLRRVREVSLEAFGNQDTPFEKLVEELQPDRHLDRSALFQVMFILQNTPQEEAILPGLELRPLGVGTETTKFDLTLTLTESADRLGAVLVYDVDLFDASTAARLLKRFATLLQAAVRESDTVVGDLELFSAEEHGRLLAEIAAAAPALPPDTFVHRLFEEQARQRPGALAVVCEERLNYGELDARANRLSHHLTGLGVRPEVPVAICLERSVEMIVALLAILKAGGYYVPLEPAQPRERLTALLRQSGAPLVITRERLAEGLTSGSAAVVCLDTDAAAISLEEPSAPCCDLAPEHPVYMLFTSGSTGAPKGVVVEHRQLLAYTRGVLERLGLPDRASFATVSTFAADLGNTAIFPALCSGGCLHVAAQQEVLDAEALAARFARDPIDCLKIVPSHLEALLHTSRPQRVLPRRCLVLGGEAARRPLVDELTALAPDCEILNHYGPTETTVGVLTHRLARGDRRPGAAMLPLGRPLRGARVHVFDEKLRPLPPGIPGELFIGGTGVSRGYAGRPNLTAERFLPDPFASIHGEAGSRLYRSGDRARVLPDGEVEFLGRVDHQIKLRGFRIEPAEVASVLASHPAVRAAAVVPRQDLAGELRLVAYVVLAAGAQTGDGELLGHLRDRLPEAMVPAVCVFLDALPLTANGKLDRAALPVPERYAGAAEGDHVPPRYFLEVQLCRIWEELLGVSPLGVRDSFFEHGGHSILAVRLQARVERELGWRFDLPTLFRAPTVEHLAAALRRGVPDRPSCLVPLQEGDGRPCFWIHPAGGEIFCYRDLVRHLGPGRPHFGIRSRGLFPGEQPLERVSEMAAEYLELVQSVDPDGPYLLGGLSMGGVVAFEMARQLAARGREVALLALLDTQAPDPARPVSDFDVLASFADVLGVRDRFILEDEEEIRALDLEAQLARVMAQAKAADAFPPDLEISDVHRIFDVVRLNTRAAHSYEAKSYPGRILLLRAAERALVEDKTRGWERYAPALEVHEVPGTHDTIVRPPNVRLLAERLQGCWGNLEA